MRFASFSTKGFFSSQQLQDIETAIGMIEGVGINIPVFHKTFRDNSYGEKEELDIQYRSFKTLAKLWHVVKEIIQIAYMDKLISGKLTLKDRQGNEYRLVLSKPNLSTEKWVMPPYLEEGESYDVHIDR